MMLVQHSLKFYPKLHGIKIRDGDVLSRYLRVKCFANDVSIFLGQYTDGSIAIEHQTWDRKVIGLNPSGGAHIDQLYTSSKLFSGL